MAEAYYRWDSNRRPPGDRRMELLWPVEIWAVQVPPPGSGINVFQEAILGLLASGVRDLPELAKQLALDKDLVAFILAQELQPRGWIDQRQTVTEKGRQALQGQTDPDQPLDVKYAFRDRLSGQWLPRLSSSLPELMPSSGGEPGRPAFDRDRNTGRTVKPFVLNSKREPMPPDVMGLRKALREFQRDLRASGDQAALIWEDLDETWIELLDEAPQPGYVWCYLYASSQDIHPWLVSDPWCVRTALKPLRLALEQKIPQESALQIRMQDRLELNAPPSRQADRDLEAQITLQAEARVQQLLGTLKSTPQGQAIRERVLRVLRLEAALKDSAHPRQEQLASLATESGAMLEALMQWVLLRWETDAHQWPKEWPRKTTEDWLAELPLAHPLAPEQIKLLGGQSCRAIRGAAMQQGQAFKALLVAGLLATQHHNDHPLRTIGARGLNLQTLQLRNHGSHATGNRLQRDDVLALADMCLTWLGEFRTYFSA